MLPPCLSLEESFRKGKRRERERERKAEWFMLSSEVHATDSNLPQTGG